MQTHLPVIQDDPAILESGAVQGKRLILATLATHVAAKPVTQAAQQQLHLANGLAQVLVRI
jgi:hypothetical protein